MPFPRASLQPSLNANQQENLDGECLSLALAGMQSLGPRLPWVQHSLVLK